MDNTVTWHEAIFSYQTTLTAVGRASGTVRLKRYYLLRIAHLSSSPANLTTGQLETFIAVQHWKPETTRSLLSTVRTFYDWAISRGLAATNPARGIPPVTIPPAVARPASDKDIARARKGTTDLRVKLMILLGATLGLRCCEIARIRETDWDGRELIVHGKGAKDRALPVANILLQHTLNDLGRGAWLFPGRIDGHLSASYVSKLIGQSLPHGITAHQLRHRFATVSWDGTHDLLAVSAALGHAKPETTKRYIRLHDANLLAAVEAANISA